MPDLGKIILTYEGEYDGARSYDRLDVVFYKGSLYWSKSSDNREEPTVSAPSWSLFLEDIKNAATLEGSDKQTIIDAARNGLATQSALTGEETKRTQADAELNKAIQTESTERTAKDRELQEQINSLVNRSDVVDVVGTHAELEAYDISKITINDIIKVLKDETQENAESYYKLEAIDPKRWTFIGSLGESYTKAESNAQIAQINSAIAAANQAIEGKISKNGLNTVQDNTGSFLINEDATHLIGWSPASGEIKVGAVNLGDSGGDWPLKLYGQQERPTYEGMSGAEKAMALLDDISSIFIYTDNVLTIDLTVLTKKSQA